MTQSAGRRTWLAWALAALGTSLVIASSANAAGLAAQLGGEAVVDRSEETGKVSFVGSSDGGALVAGPASVSPAAAARSFLSDHAGSFGLGGEDTGLTVADTEPTPWDGTAVRLAQTHAGVPVMGGLFVVNVDGDGDVLSVLGEATPSPDVAPSAARTASEAKAAAIATVARAKDIPADDLSAGEPELQIFDPRLIGAAGPFQEARLSWVLDVKAGPLSGVDEHVVVDADTGAVGVHFSNDEEALNRTVCNANNTTSNVPCVAPVRIEGGAPVANDNDDINRAYDFAGDTYNFFFSRFGRDSLDGAGMQLRQTVDFCPVGSCPNYANAFWNGQQMVYGEGYASADDVVGHELAHGVTDFTSHLFYYFQSGAINESMSDVFGEFVDLTNTTIEPIGDRWKLAEGLPGLPNGIRNMANPPLFNDPDRIGSPFYTADPAEGDSGGVHSNSGVNNKAAFLMTDGGTFNGQAVTGLGIPKIARLYYTVNTFMLVSGSDYADLANALRQACANLAGAGIDGFTAADCAEVQKALVATEMDVNPPVAPTTGSAPCPAGQGPVDAFFDNIETGNATFVTQTIVGPNNWSYPQNPNPIVFSDGSLFDATYTTSGVRNLFGYDRFNAASDSAIRMANPVAVPASGFLHFNHAFGFEDSPATQWDGGVLEFSTAGAAGPWTDAGTLIVPGGGQYNGTIDAGPLNGRPGFVAESNGYGSTKVDLSTLAGQSVMFRWRLSNDATNTAFEHGWYIDDIRVYSCANLPVPDTTAPETTIDSGPKKKTTKKKAKLKFSANEPATFVCKLDKKDFQPCGSPSKFKAKKFAKHKVLVRAVDLAGNVDPTPAKRKWKRKHKRS